MSRAFLLALQFLTRLPMPAGPAPTPLELGRAALAYPLAGLVIGGAMWALAAALPTAPVLPLAATLLAWWALASGGLHLDGLADAADAWAGGHDRERALAIMKDPRAGPIAVMVVVLVLIAKFAALAALLEAEHRLPLLVAPAFGRAAILLVLLRLPYVRPQGLGSPLAEHLPRRAAWGVAAAVLVLAAFVDALLALAAALLVLAWLCRTLRTRLGGTTGDTLGAAVELTEAAWLLGCALG